MQMGHGWIFRCLHWTLPGLCIRTRAHARRSHARVLQSTLLDRLSTLILLGRTRSRDHARTRLEVTRHSRLLLHRHDYLYVQLNACHYSRHI